MENKKEKNFHLTLTPFVNESRILKEVESLIGNKLFSKITVIAEGRKGLPPKEKINNSVYLLRISLPLFVQRKGFVFKLLRIIIYTIKSFIYLLREVSSASTITCHSLLCLHIGVVFKIIKNVGIVYDAHELESQQDGYSEGLKRFLKSWEKKIIKYVDYTIVVSDSINKWYKENYQVKNIVTVKNIPSLHASKNRKEVNMKEEYHLDDDDILFIYVGNLGIGRFIEPLVEIFKKHKENKHILFMGYGDCQDIIIRNSREASNIHFHTSVAPEEVISYIKSCDVGLSIIENNGLSYFYCLPNKLFEYTVSGIPSIVSDFPEMSQFVKTIQVGWVVNPNVNEVERCILSITPKQIKQYKDRVRELNYKMSWENEVPNLLKAYIQGN